MGFPTVYRCLRELFPQLDSRLLKAVAIEHPKDVDAAAEIILSEVIPFMNQEAKVPDSDPESSALMGQSDGEVDESNDPNALSRRRHSSKRPVVGNSNAKLVASASNANFDGEDDCTNADFLHGDDSPFYDANDENDQANGVIDDEDMISSKNAQETSVLQVGQTSEVGKLSILSPCGADYSNEASGNAESEELILLETRIAQEPNCCSKILDVVPTTSSVVNGNLRSLDVGQIDSDHGDIDVCQNSCDTESAELGNVVLLQPLSPREHFPGDLYCCSQVETDACSNNFANGNVGSSAVESEADKCGNDNGDADAESPSNMTRSGQICSVELLEEIVEDAKNNKKTLFLAMESVMSMMREVEEQEKAVEQAQEDAAMGGLDTFAKVEELKRMLAHAKEANDMHAGEVYGEKAVLATEVRELQSRLRSLSDERDKSLAILNEMHESLESRLAAAEEMRKAAEEEKLEKEELARSALAEQEAIMEKVVQESKLLQEEAEENSKLREFLMDRGRIVDTLQGEISVICLDVKSLKEKFDERVPLSKSISSNQTSCLLASSSSSRKSASSRSSSSAILNEAESCEMPSKIAETASAKDNCPEKTVAEEKEKDAWKELTDLGWEFFDKDSEFGSGNPAADGEFRVSNNLGDH